MKIQLGARGTLLTLVALLALMAAGLVSARNGVFASPAAIRPAGDAAAQAANKIEASVLADTASGKTAQVVILLADQADVSAAYNMKDQDARGWYVYNTLSQHAERSQAGLKTMLKTQGIAFQSYWAANMLIATADRALVNSLAARADVARIESSKAQRWIERDEVANYGVTTGPTSPNAIEPGVSNVNAPQVWALGYTGQGIVIGGLDTGIRWTHNTIKPKYRGWNGTTADHNYNWHDSIHSGGGACGANTVAPCDDNQHGTHTVGTVVGDDGAGNQIGVAPGAKWIGCRNMDVGNGTPATYTECFQWTIAPTDLAGNNPNPALRPHVLNNSWGCPASEGCAAGTLQTIVANTRAAGIFVEVSAGNSGPGCSTLTDPPSFYAEAFSTGAISSANNTIASFSSRGPVTADGSNRLKPNISAPGVNVRSAVNTSDTAYNNLSGTSMAGPHVVGVVALLWSARPQLARNIAGTEAVLQNSANPNVVVNPVQTCGGIPSSTIPNNTFGYGRVDALAAVNSVAQGTPTPTITPGGPTATRTTTVTVTATASPTVCGGSSNYSIATATGATVVPATTFVAGSNCDDCVNAITLPFPFRLYDQTFNTANVDSNGTVQFLSSVSTFSNTCLPYAAANYAILPHWDDLLLTGANQGIYTNVSGSAPNRIFDIEWRGGYFSGGGTVNFEVRLYENSPTGQFDIIYGTVTQTGTSATIGVQKDTGSVFTQFSCNTASLSAGLKLTFTQPPCGTAGPTLTAGLPTGTATRTVTPGGQASATPTCVAGGGLPGPWRISTPAAPTPGPRYRAGGTSGGGFVYVYGGANGPTLLNDLWRWDPATETWTQLANMPTAKQNIQGAYYNGKIYVPGGYTTVHITENAIYDVATNTWTTGAALPAPQTGTTAAFNGRIYNIGGNPGPQATLSIYDIATNTWGTGAPMPVATTYGRSVTAGSYIYYAGGIAASATTNAFYRYDPGANSWITLTPLQTPRTSEELMSTSTSIFAVAGGDNTFFNGVPLAQTVETYTIATNVWTYGSPVVQTLAGPGGGLAGNKLMIQGGTNATLYYNTVQVSDLVGSVPCTTGTPSGGTATATRTGTAAPSSTPLLPTITPSLPTVTATVSGGTPTCVPIPVGAPKTIGLGNPGTIKSIRKGTGPSQPQAGRGSSSSTGDAANNWKPTAPISFILDDGTQESSIGLTNGTTNYPAIWVNRFSPAATDYPLVLNQISIQFPNAARAGRDLTGLGINLLVYLDADGNQDPSNAVKLAQIPATITVANGTTFSNYAVNVTVAGPGDIYLGFADTYNSGGVTPSSYPAALDTNNSQGRSWVAGKTTNANPDYNNLANNDQLSTIDTLGLPGNWVIRASGQSQVVPCVSPTVGLPTVTGTSIPTNTATVPVVSGTPTSGPPASVTRTSAPGVTATATVCPIQFQDVAVTDPFYTFIRCLACRGIISGYTCGGVGEPCVPPANNPYFRTGALITRAQVSKIVSLAAGLNAPIPSGQQTFEDVPSSNPFWPYIERLATAGYISGYACGGASEPCQPPANRPYFRPFASITRGQLAKIDTNAAGYTDVIPSGQQTFEDVPNANPFWLYIERASIHGVISGYTCGGAGEPCNPPGNRPYFRTFASTTRGQASKIVANTFFPGCNTPSR